MRVINQIIFTAKDDAEAMRLASERLGRDAVILSTQIVKEGGIFGMFQKSVLKVTAGILEEDDTKPQIKKQNNSSMDDQTRRENLIAFQKLMEFKERSVGNGNFNNSDLGGEGYTAPDGDTVKISDEGLKNAYGLTTKPVSAPSDINNNNKPEPEKSISNKDAEILKNQLGALADRVDFLLERLTAVESGIMQNNNNNNSQPKQQLLNLNPNFKIFNQNSNFSPEDNGIEARLRASEVDEKYIRKLLADYAVFSRKDKNKKQPFTKWLAAQIECSADNKEDPVGGRKVMLLGPTGVGKTTTIAKLAAIKALWEHKKVLLLTSDTYRIAAVEQLKIYAKILGVPIEIIFDISALPNVINEHENSEIILLDTAGRSQRDKKNFAVYEDLYNAFLPDAVHLVLSANMKYKDMLDVVEHIPNIPVSHLLFTKLDETVSYGSIFNIQQVMGCPVSFLTVGQNVPKDIETASGSRIADFLMKPEDERKK